MKLFTIKTFHNEEGSAIVVALLMGLALSLAVFMAMENTFSDNRMMRSNRTYRDNSYKAETGITIAVEEHKTTWLASNSTLFSDASGNATEGRNNVTIGDLDGNNTPVASYLVARIQGSPAAGSESAKYPYKINHQAPPRVGSGTSPKTFEIRRYGIRSTAQPDNRLTVESGLSKTFNKN